jgi:NADH-quinone oxidoreductase subunit M
MIQKVFFGPENSVTQNARDIWGIEKVALSLIVIMIVVFGLYPQPLLNVTDGFADALLKKADVTYLISK